MVRHLDASFVTEVVILLGWALTTWYVYFTFKESGHAKRKTITLTLGVLAWSITYLYLANRERPLLVGGGVLCVATPKHNT